MKKLLFLLFILFTATTFSQNLTYTSITWPNGAISDTLDLGTDLNYLGYDYNFGTEQRAVGLWFDGTWTNTSLAVYACTTLAGTYDVVKGSDGTTLTITMASNTWVWLKPTEFAGLRYIRLVGSAEGGARTLVLIKRIY